MSKRIDLIEILQICEKYEPGNWVCAEHDIIYVLGSDASEKVSPEDRERLDSLGAHFDSEADGWTVFT